MVSQVDSQIWNKSKHLNKSECISNGLLIEKKIVSPANSKCDTSIQSFPANPYMIALSVPLVNILLNTSTTGVKIREKRNPLALILYMLETNLVVFPSLSP